MALEPTWSLRLIKQQGLPITVRGRRLIPESRVLMVQSPFGGFVWNHPAAVLVESNGQRLRMAIYDKTRLLELVLLSLPLILLAFAGLWRSSKRERKHW